MSFWDLFRSPNVGYSWTFHWETSVGHRIAVYCGILLGALVGWALPWTVLFGAQVGGVLGALFYGPREIHSKIVDARQRKRDGDVKGWQKRRWSTILDFLEPLNPVMQVLTVPLWATVAPGLFLLEFLTGLYRANDPHPGHPSPGNPVDGLW